MSCFYSLLAAAAIYCVLRRLLVFFIQPLCRSLFGVNKMMMMMKCRPIEEPWTAIQGYKIFMSTTISWMKKIRMREAKTAQWASDKSVAYSELSQRGPKQHSV